jgi:IS5 family transposase
VRGRLRRALDELAVTIERTGTIVSQTRTRLAGRMPERATRLVSLHDPDARPIREGTHRPATEHRRSFRRLVNWRTGSEGRISYLKHSYGWDLTRLDGRQGAAIWCGNGVFAHNPIKIGTLAS